MEAINMDLTVGSIFSFEGLVPVVDPESFLHPTATLIGSVFIGARCYVGAGAVLRGDFGCIVMKPGSNFQDNCVAHSFPGCDMVIEEDGHVGHGAVLHGCTIKRNALVGMNAVVMDGAVIGEDAIVAAAAMVPAGFVLPPRTLAAGIPATVQRALSEEEMLRKANGTRLYQELAARSLRSMVRCAPRTFPWGKVVLAAAAFQQPEQLRSVINLAGLCPAIVQNSSSQQWMNRTAAHPVADDAPRRMAYCKCVSKSIVAQPWNAIIALSVTWCCICSLKTIPPFGQFILISPSPVVMGKPTI
jgi:phenylacetic acid degradation protein